MGRTRLAIAICAFALGGCALREAHDFRRTLAAAVGQPVARLHEQLGPNEGQAAGDGRHYDWATIVIGRDWGDCNIAVVADAGGIVRAATMTGGDFTCGHYVAELRHQAERDRRDPGRRAREDAEVARLLASLVRARHELSEARHCPCAAPEQPQ